MKRALWFGIVSGSLMLSLVCFASPDDGQFAVMQASTRLAEQVYLLDADLTYELSEESINALHNAVPLTLVLHIEVRHARWYLWDEKIADINQRYELKYHSLSERYLLTHLNTGLYESFFRLPTALRAMGKVRALPLLDKPLVNAEQGYSVRLNSYLDIESLPAPLRPVAYFSKEWRLASEVYVCPLKP